MESSAKRNIIYSHNQKEQERLKLVKQGLRTLNISNFPPLLLVIVRMTTLVLDFLKNPQDHFTI